MHCLPMESPRRRLRSICTVGKHKKRRLPLEQRTFPLYEAPLPVPAWDVGDLAMGKQEEKHEKGGAQVP